MSSKYLLYSLNDLIWTSLGTRGEFDQIFKSAWKAIADGGCLKYKLEDPPNMKPFDAELMRVFVLVLMSRFDKRREPTSFKMIDEPCSKDIFNFTKIKPSETLFHLSFEDIDNCDGHIIANASPFMFGHSLIVPNCNELMNQVLRKSPLHLALKIMLLSADDLLAYASVNHLHFHLWYSTQRLYASNCPVRRKEFLPRYLELDFHPVDNFVFEFNNLEDFHSTFECLWRVIEECHRLRIAHNLYAARNTTGILRVVFWPRRSAFGAKACQRHLGCGNEASYPPHTLDFDVAVAELAGMLVVPDVNIAQELTACPGHLLEVYVNEKLEKQLMSELEKALK
ncbi:hypothetical protein Aperf_G00000065795 [Anoplocephala perfoliata]